MNRLMNAALLAATALTLSLLPGLSATAAAAESGTVEPGSMSTADRQQAEANTAEEQQRKKEAAEEAPARQKSWPRNSAVSAPAAARSAR